MWHRMFNEAISNLSASGQWYDRTGQNLQTQTEDSGTQFQKSMGTLGVELVETGPWCVTSPTRLIA